MPMIAVLTGLTADKARANGDGGGSTVAPSSPGGSGSGRAP